MSWWGVGLDLLTLQVVLGGLCYFAYSYPWVARLIGLLFLAAAAQTALPLRALTPARAFAAALLGQLPGLLGSINVALEQLPLYRHNSLGDILDFLMESWHTVLLPWLRFLPARAVPTRSGEAVMPFFLALPLLSPLLVGWVLLTATLFRR